MTVRQNWYMLITKAMATRFAIGSPPICETCGSDDITLRRLTMERELALESDVKFLCNPCYYALGPIPFSARDTKSEPSIHKVNPKKPGQIPSAWKRTMEKRKTKLDGIKV
jgi:hypothetical protein